MELQQRSWDELEIVKMGTIYEDDEEEENVNLSSSTPILPTRGLAADPEVTVFVHDSCFCLHKAPLTARSDYMRRELRGFSEITLAPPLNITAETFSMVADFCYGATLAVTPFNVAALRTASELLGMTAVSASGEENLQQITEAYFRRVVDVNAECACIVLESCFQLLPEAETAGSLVSRCLKTLSETAACEGDLSCLEGFRDVAVEDLDLILAAASRRLSGSHDILYTIIDIHLKGNGAKVTGEQKIQMCNYIDCSTLSTAVLMHAVGNARMPLRFVLQAMFMEQLNTRHCMISDSRIKKKEEPLTLAAVLHHDAAVRQVTHLKAAMSATNSRVRSLEKELGRMRKLLDEPGGMIDSGRSASVRLSTDSRKIDRGQIGSISSSSMKPRSSSWCEEPSDREKKPGPGFIRGLMSALRLQKKHKPEA